MLLYVFADHLTGEIQSPVLAHNDDEAIRIARMSFANVPQQILRDLYIAKVLCYDYDTDPMFSLLPLYRGLQFISETEVNND